MYQYCDTHGIPYKRCGKVIVAIDDDEIPRLKELYARGVENGVKGISLIDKTQLTKLEPNCKVSNYMKCVKLVLPGNSLWDGTLYMGTDFQ